MCLKNFWHINKCRHVGSWIYLFESDLFSQITSVEFCSMHYPSIEGNLNMLTPDVYVCADAQLISWGLQRILGLEIMTPDVHVCADACWISWVLQHSMSFPNDRIICALLYGFRWNFIWFCMAIHNLTYFVQFATISDDCYFISLGQKHPGHKELSWSLNDTPCVLVCNSFSKGMKISYWNWNF